MNLPKNIKNLGFTLVELMVVISIIAVLATAAAVSYSSVSINNRDAQRLRDLTSLKQALELYFQANNYYPWNIGTYSYKSTTNPNSWIPGLIPTYFDTIPTDPLNNGSYFYTYDVSSEPIAIGPHPSCLITPSQNQYYILTTILEALPGNNPDQGVWTCNPTMVPPWHLIPTWSRTYYITSQ